MASGKKSNPDRSQRIIALYVSLIAVPALFFLFLSIRSIVSQWRVLIPSSDADLQHAGESLVSDLEARTMRRAEAYLENVELAQIASLADSLPDPRAARQIRLVFERVSKRDPVGRYPFIVRNGWVEFPILRPATTVTAQSIIRQEQSPAAANFASVFQGAERQHVGNRCPTNALKAYLQASELPVSARLKAVALERAAGCFRDQKQFSRAAETYAEIAEKYRDEYDVSGTPYPIVAAFAMETLGPAKPADLRDRFARLHDELVRGRWEVTAQTLEKLETVFRRRLGNDVPDTPTEFLAHMQCAQALQAALRRKSDPGLLYRVNGDQSSRDPARPGDILAFAFADRANSYQSFYSVVGASSKKQFWLGFTVDMEWLQRDILPEIGAAGAFVITYKSGAGDATPHANFNHLFPFWQLSTTPAFVRSSVVRADFFVLGGSLLLVLLGGLGIVLLMRSVRQQREYARMRIDFVNGVSHELKTPITLIRLYAETLLGDQQLKPAHGPHCQIILNEAERLTHLVEHILDFSRGERNLREYNFKVGDLCPIVERTVQGCRDYLAPRKFVIGGVIRKDLPPVRFDPEAIPSLVLNLVDNAVKYSGNSKLVNVETFAQNDHVIIEVQDFGIGIPASEKEKIFEPYYRVDTGVARGGCGLGLALVKNIMEAHGGRVEVLSDVAFGSKFSLVFPVAHKQDTFERSRSSDRYATARAGR